MVSVDREGRDADVEVVVFVADGRGKLSEPNEKDEVDLIEEKGERW